MVLLGVATPSEPFVAAAVAVLLFAVSRPIIRRVARENGGDWLVKVLTVSLILHLIAAPMQIWVVDHFYGGIADWLRYDNQGSVLGTGFRHLDFSTSVVHLHTLVGDGSVSIIAALVFAVVGVNQAAAFLIFSWFSFLGLILFYRAFIITFGGAGYRRYAILLFFLPSLIFWTADVSKEAIMTIALGLIVYGLAKVLVRQRGGVLPIALGSFIAAWVRPNELFLVVGGAVVAVMIMPSAPWVHTSGARRALSFVFLAGVLALSAFLTVHFLHGKGGSLSLQGVTKNNSGKASSVSYSSSPGYFPHDVYVVLFDPTLLNAHGKGELLAALENLVIIGVILSSLRQLRILVRAAFARPYVMMCLIYSVGFIYTFAALGDLGLITRERTLLLPFFLVLLSIPRTPKGQPARYEWEYRREERKRRQRSRAARTGGLQPSGAGRSSARSYARPARASARAL